MSEADGARRTGGGHGWRSASIRLWPAVLAIVAVALALVPGTAAADRARRREVIVVQVASPAAFTAPTEACPAGVASFALTGPAGRQVGTASACLREFIETGPTAVTSRSSFTLSLRRGDIVVDLTSAQRFFEADPGLIFEDFSGPVVRGTRAYRNRTGRIFGGGSVRVADDGTLTPDAVVVIVLDRRR
jgi:uncharacterized membrane-anchored protein